MATRVSTSITPGFKRTSRTHMGAPCSSATLEITPTGYEVHGEICVHSTVRASIQPKADATKTTKGEGLRMVLSLRPSNSRGRIGRRR
jgi:hypothetical protein